jgi:hypothetical protein
MTSSPCLNRRSCRRLAPRAGLKVILRSNALDIGPNLALAVLDLSDTGARLRVRGALRPGQAVSLTLEAGGNGKAVVRPAKVVWSTPAGSDLTADAGFQFEKTVSYAELHHLARI